MRERIVFVFAGQGSQYYQMGRELFLLHPTFRYWMLELNDCYRQLTGISVIAELYGDGYGPADVWNRLKFTHPGIFMVEYALTQALAAEGIRPDVVMGSSLGEYAACAVAGVLPYPDILACIAKQVEHVETFCPPGGMLAILHDYKTYEDEPALREQVELAAINYDSHFVVAGLADRLAHVEQWLERQGIVHQRLPVAYPFHSAGLEAAGAAQRRFLQTKTFRPPQVELISCRQGQRLGSIEQHHFWNMVRDPMDVRRALAQLGAEQEGGIMVDVSPTNTLSLFIKHNGLADRFAGMFSVLHPYRSTARNWRNIVSGINQVVV